MNKLSRIRKSLYRAATLLSGFLFIVACADPPGLQEGDDVVVGAVISSNFVSLATWEVDRQSVWVRGVANRGDKIVTMTNADSGELFGSVVVDSRRRWRFAKSFSNPILVPCRLNVSSASLQAIVDVSNSPGNCNGGVSTNNSPPNGTIVNPSSDFAIRAGEKVFFSATASDPENDAVNYLWSFNGVAQNSQAQTPGNIAFPNKGVYTVTLTVSDIFNNVDPRSATRTITVSDAVVVTANRAPDGNIVSPGQDVNIAAGQAVQFSGSGSDPDGDTLRYRWDFDGVVPNSGSQNPGRVVFPTPGTYHVTLTVRDDKGLSDPTPVVRMITVTDPVVANRAPNGSIISPNQDVNISAGQSVQFSGFGSDPDGDALTYRWDFNGVVQNATVQNPGQVVFPIAGTYHVKLTVSDSKGLSDPSPVVRMITVTDPVVENRAPNGSIVSPTQDVNIIAGESVQFSGSGSDPDGDSLTYRWDFNGVIPNTIVRNPGQVVFPTAGTYHVKLTVSDSKGLSDSSPAVRMVTVTNQNTPPNGQIVVPNGNLVAYVGDTVQFSASATDSEGDPISYRWSFGGGIPDANQQNASVVFNQTGNYNVSLIATDSNGAADPSPATILVSVIGIQPTQNNNPNGLITSPAGDVVINVGESVLFKSEGTDPDNNAPLGFHWMYSTGEFMSHVQNPGYVMFSQPGSYRVSMTVTDALGAADPLVPVRIVTVLGTPSNTPPVGTIVAPFDNRTINVGESLFLSASGSDVDGDTLSYHWDLGGAGPNLTSQIPGNVFFHNVGTYRIQLHVTDSRGAIDVTPPEILLTVQNVNTSNEAPMGSIQSPINDLVIFAGDTVDFASTGFDPDGNTPLTYAWNFDGNTVGGAPVDSTLQNPGQIQFVNAGVYRVSMTVTDSKGLSSVNPAVRIITVRDFANSNQPPNGQILSPESNSTIYAGDTIDFIAFATDADNNWPISYRWDFDGAHPSSILQNPQGISFNQAGTYRVQLTVTDALGASDPDPAIRTITVLGNSTQSLAPNGVISQPVSNQTIVVGDRVYFDASGTDPDGDFPLTYRWSFGGAVPDVIGKTPGNVTFNRVGTFLVRLTVTDSTGVSDPVPDERWITVISVSSLNQAPEVTMTAPLLDRTINAGDSVYFDATGSDPDGHYPLSYLWDFNGASPNVTGAIPGSISFQYPGIYYIRVKTVDALGLSSAQYVQRVITVLQAGGGGSNQAPVAAIAQPTSDVTIQAGQNVYFAGNAYDPDGDTPLAYYWNFSPLIGVSSVQNPGNIRFNSDGIYPVQLVVTDSKGKSSLPVEILVTVGGNGTTGNNPPNGTIVSPASDIVISRYQSVNFTSNYFDADGDNVTYHWNFDGVTYNRTTANPGWISFDERGTFEIILTVTDNSGFSDPIPAKRTVTVTN